MSQIKTGVHERPKRMIKKTKHGTTIFERTRYGSYVNIEDDGMAQQKNATSYKDLLKYGYKPTTRKKKVKDVCLKCAYWTQKKGHSRYKCYTSKCPAKQRDDKLKPKRQSRGPVWKTVSERKPFCPMCGSELRRARGDVATMHRWECSSFRCNYVA